MEIDDFGPESAPAPTPVSEQSLPVPKPISKRRSTKPKSASTRRDAPSSSIPQQQRQHESQPSSSSSSSSGEPEVRRRSFLAPIRPEPGQMEDVVDQEVKLEREMRRMADDMRPPQENPYAEPVIKPHVQPEERSEVERYYDDVDMGMENDLGNGGGNNHPTGVGLPPEPEPVKPIECRYHEEPDMSMFGGGEELQVCSWTASSQFDGTCAGGLIIARSYAEADSKVNEMYPSMDINLQALRKNVPFAWPLRYLESAGSPTSQSSQQLLTPRVYTASVMVEEMHQALLTDADNGHLQAEYDALRVGDGLGQVFCAMADNEEQAILLIKYIVYMLYRSAFMSKDNEIVDDPLERFLRARMVAHDFVPQFVSW